jgi:hypothetical protein
MAVKDITSFVPKEARIGLGVAVAGGLLYWVYKKLNKTPEEEQEEQLEEGSGRSKRPGNRAK